MDIDQISNILSQTLKFVENRYGHKKATDLVRDVVAENIRHHPEDFYGIVQAIFNIVLARDAYTAGHQKRVSMIATGVSESFGLEAHDIIGITLAASVHDLGKIRVPHEILSKPSSITNAEYSILKEHALIGHDLLAPINFPWPIAKVALQHHERMDGSGYPQQSKGGDIIIEAKIVAVSDIVEAISSHRPYRASLGLEAALREVETGAGTAFDPIVVSACTKWCRKNADSLRT